MEAGKQRPNNAGDTVSSSGCGQHRANTDADTGLTDYSAARETSSFRGACHGLNSAGLLFEDDPGLIILLLSTSVSSSVKWGQKQNLATVLADLGTVTYVLKMLAIAVALTFGWR